MIALGKNGNVRFAVRLTPKAGRDRVEKWEDGANGRRQLRVRVSAAPHDGKANAALIELLSESLGVPKTAIAIAAGQKARLKTIEIAGDTAMLKARLEALGDCA